MPPSDPILRISLSKPFQNFNRLQLTSRCQWTLTTKKLSPNIFTQVSHTLKLLQLKWRNESYNETHSISRYSKMKNKKMIQCFVFYKLKAQNISCAFCFCLLESFKLSWIWFLIVWAQKLAVMHILSISGLSFIESGKPFSIRIHSAQYPAFRLAVSGKPLATVTTTVKKFLNLYFDPKTL